MKRIRVSLLLLFLISLFTGYLLERVFPQKKVDESLYLNEVAPDIRFLKKQGTYYPSEKGIVAFNTYDITPHIRGYAGAIKVLVALMPDGRISGIKLLEHKETPNYVHRMETPEFLRQFLGKSINDPFEVDKDIDGISRATVSVSAMARTVRGSGRLIAKEVMGLEVIDERKPQRFSLKWSLYLLLFIASLSSYLITRSYKKFLRLRDISLILSIAIIGLWLSSPFSIIHIFNLLLLRLSTDLLWYVVVGTTVLSIVVAGRFYCGWLCPFGGISEFLGRLPSKKWDIPHEIDDRWRNTKYYLLGLIIIVVFAFRRPEFGNLETYITLFSFKGNVFTWSLVVISLVLSLRSLRFWCRYLCPVGAVIGIFSRLDNRYISSPACPMSNKPMPHASECIRCNRCYKA